MREKLKELGINILTGERCNIGIRLLCDLSEKGVETIQNHIGFTPSAENWNSYVGEDKAVKSIMLTQTYLDFITKRHALTNGKRIFQAKKSGHIQFVDADEKYTLRYMNHAEYEEVKSCEEEILDVNEFGVTTIENYFDSKIHPIQNILSTKKEHTFMEIFRHIILVKTNAYLLEDGTWKPENKLQPQDIIHRRFIINRNHPNTGANNIHQMSGRC